MTPIELRDCYRRLLNTEDGERILDDLGRRFHIDQSTYSTEPTDTAYREGQRTVVLFIKSMLREWDKQLEEQINE